MAAFFVSPKDKALATAAFFYIYSKGRVPKATFNDPVFRDMLQAYFEAGGGKVVVLRMNRAFMKYMRQSHPGASEQHFNITLLEPGDNKEEETVVSGEDSGGDLGGHSWEDSWVDSEVDSEEEPGVAV
jgi:hypothetical protein